jgi:hypothetical protein
MDLGPVYAKRCNWIGNRRRTVSYDADEVEFLKWIDYYKRRYHRPFPTWREVLALVKVLGYKKSSVGEAERADDGV